MQLQSIRASDADMFGGDARIRYSFRSGNTNDIFQIDPDNGTITVVRSLDYETMSPRYVLEIVATDSARNTPQKEAVHMLIVNVTNLNDNKPLFAQPSYLFTIVEDYPKGTSVGFVKATDLDKDDCVNYGWNSTSGDEGKC